MNQKLDLLYKIVFFIGVLSILIGIGSYINVNSLIKNQIYQNLVLANDSKAFGFFKNPPARVLRKYYIFDVKNARDVERGRAKPKLVQRGPYTYSELFDKVDIQFKDKNTVDFSPKFTLIFEPSLSAGNESDMVTFLNVPLVSMINSIMKNDDSDFTATGINSLLNLQNIKLFVTKSVKELIAGYEDPLMKLAKNFGANVTQTKFSLINEKNGTTWQRFSIKTGYDDIKDIGKIISWNNKTKLDYWDNDYANTINGSDGTIYPPNMTRDQILYSFSPDMCRSYRLEYLRDNMFEGAKTLDFHLPKNIFFYSTLNPDNEGFCSNNCLGNGVLNISKCYGGSPSFISQPHFLNADEKFKNDVIGMHPNDTLHDFIIHFEPNTGVALSANIRLQINFYLQKFKKIDLVKNVKSCLFPFIWFDEDIKTHSHIVKQLSLIDLYINIGNLIPIVLLLLGAIFMLFGLVIVVFRLMSILFENENTGKIKKLPIESSLNTDEPGEKESESQLIKS